MPDPSQFNTDRTYPGRWTITFNNPPINMFVQRHVLLNPGLTQCAGAPCQGP
jgi:hypothetical protein